MYKSLCLLLFCCVMITFFGCNEDDPTFTPENIEPTTDHVTLDIDPEFRPFYKTFIQEANLRGVELDTSNLSINFGDALPVAGNCNLTNIHVKINRNFWEGSSNCFKEFLIFHELGHCLLKRLHTSAFSGGYKRSIMYAKPNEDPLGLHENLLSASMDLPFRKFYVDELFNETVDDAPWMNGNISYSLLTEDRNLVAEYKIGPSETIEISEIPTAFVLEIELNQETVHTDESSVIEDGTSYVPSLKIYDEYTKYIIDRLRGGLSFLPRCNKWASNLYDSNSKITIVNHEDLAYFFIDEEFVLIATPLSSNFKMNSRLSSGISNIALYEL